MADDRLDDAIDAVVRAVDRIERATRRQAIVDEAHARDAHEPIAEPVVPVHDDARPPMTSVAPGRDAWSPVLGGAGDGGEAPRDEPERPRGGESSHGDERPRKKDKSKKKHRDERADHELHELVGRIVVRTQELDDHLLHARALRDEISELVARLAAAADHRR